MAPLTPGLPLQAAPLMPNGLPANRATLQSQREITIANDLIG
ncbi:unnamed protein product, partial [Rotaria magnacalcarata]